MLASNTLNLLRRSVGQVIETMCFADVTGMSPRDPFFGEEPITSVVKFGGPFDGHFQVALGTEAAAALVESFLGSPGIAPSDRQSAAMVCELSQIICGHFLSSLVPSEEISMSSPVLKKSDFSGPFLSERFLLHSGTLTAAVQLNRKLAPKS